MPSSSKPLLTSIRTQISTGELVVDGVTDIESFLKGAEYVLELERKSMAEASREGQRKAKEAGVHIGRPYGATTSRERSKLYPFEPLIRQMLSQGATVAEIARKVSVDRHTVTAYINKYLK